MREEGEEADEDANKEQDMAKTEALTGVRASIWPELQTVD